MSKVIYLTGAPAAGKSSLTRLLFEQVRNLRIWEYGARLTEHCAARSADIIVQDDLRAKSAAIVTEADVTEVDAQLLAFVNDHRGKSPIIVDSHAVTKESYGYRITPFSLEQFACLNPDEIWVLYISPEETRRRIGNDAGGRPMVTEEEARTHTTLQASVAATYGMAIGCPVYMFDGTLPQSELVAKLGRRLS